MPSDDRPRALTREDLYELIWSKPASDLAKDFGISDVALAKRCRKLGIPVPGRGYWARIDAGRKPYRPKLPTREDKFSDEQALMPVSVQLPEENASSESNDVADANDAAILSQIAAITLAQTKSIKDATIAVRRTAWQMKHSGRGELIFGRGERAGPIVPLDVSDSALNRSLLFADVLLTAAATLGWTFESPPITGAVSQSQHSAKTPAPAVPVSGQIRIDGEYVAFRIEERMREVPRTPTAGELAREKREYSYSAPRKTLEATGALRIARIDTYQRYWGLPRQTWYDRRSRPVEHQIKNILAAFYELAKFTKERRAEDERKAREQAEAESRQKQFEERQAAHSRLINQSETDAGAWHRAKFLRRYLKAARRHVGDSTVPASFLNKSISFFDWAEDYVNQLDPLHASPRRNEFAPKRSGYYGSDAERFKESMSRLVGQDWKAAWKVSADHPPPPESTDRSGYSYPEKPVFEVSASRERPDEE